MTILNLDSSHLGPHDIPVELFVCTTPSKNDLLKEETKEEGEAQKKPKKKKVPIEAIGIGSYHQNPQPVYARTSETIQTLLTSQEQEKVEKWVEL